MQVTSFENCTDVGVFAMLTNTYCLCAQSHSVNFYSALQEVLGDHIPIIRTSINETTLVGAYAIGNRYGLLLPSVVTDSELMHIRNSLPDDVRVVRIDQPLLLNNFIACNDSVALISPDLSPEIEAIVQDVLQVETYRQAIGNENLVGSFCRITNQGGLFAPFVSKNELMELTNMLQIKLSNGTIMGSSTIASGLLVNDWAMIIGEDAGAAEIHVAQKTFNINVTQLDGDDMMKLMSEQILMLD
eukprot:TRINITY_DN3054_c0_g1_i2.p1 TRINITY_DN3054_c0_g1~~TRINITY_DN3054_c0_g1_i2.p1  ORF type:complete len:244 (+),score=76.30 TRINITY_DN3054_c0_g1_i2:41-772(+)